jgi:RNase P/RNase MRP subunit POP5
MVVKQTRGRKRYISFAHSSGVSRNKINTFFNNSFKELKGKIKTKVVKYDSEKGIVRVDHKLAQEAREIMNRDGLKMGIKTIKTSGTLKGLE